MRIYRPCYWNRNWIYFALHYASKVCFCSQKVVIFISPNFTPCSAKNWVFSGGISNKYIPLSPRAALLWVIYTASTCSHREPLSTPLLATSHCGKLPLMIRWLTAITIHLCQRLKWSAILYFCARLPTDYPTGRSNARPPKNTYQCFQDRFR